MNQSEKKADEVLSLWQDRIKLSKALNLGGVVRYDIDAAEAVLHLARAGIVKSVEARRPSRWTVFWLGLWAGVGIEIFLR